MLQKQMTGQLCFSNAGTVFFGYNYILTSNSGTGSAIGNFQINIVQQQLFRKTGSGVYADNNYYIRGKEVNSSTIEFLYVWKKQILVVLPNC